MLKKENVISYDSRIKLAAFVYGCRQGGGVAT